MFKGINNIEYRTRERAFTIIELMITISLITLLTVALLPAMRSYDKRNKLVVASEQLKSDIMETRNFALAPRSEDTGVDKYVLRLDDLADEEKTPVRYKIIAVKKDPANPGDFKDETIFSRVLPSGVVIRNGIAGACPNSTVNDATKKVFEIAFKPPYGNLSLDTVFDFNNLSASGDCGVTSDATPFAWSSKEGVAIIQLRDKGATCPSVSCKNVKVNSYSGQVVIE